MDFEGFTYDSQTGKTSGLKQRPNLDVDLEDVVKEKRELRKREAKNRRDAKTRRTTPKGGKIDTKKKEQENDKKKGDKKNNKKNDGQSKDKWQEIKIKEGVLRQILSAAGVDAPSDKYELRLVASKKK